MNRQAKIAFLKGIVNGQVSGDELVMQDFIVVETDINSPDIYTDVHGNKYTMEQLGRRAKNTVIILPCKGCKPLKNSGHES